MRGKGKKKLLTDVIDRLMEIDPAMKLREQDRCEFCLQVATGVLVLVRDYGNESRLFY